MIETNDLISMVVFLVVFLATCGLAVLLVRYFNDDRRRTRGRLRDLSAQAPAALPSERLSVSEFVLEALPRVGQVLLPEEGEQRDRLQNRLMQAGVYGPQALRLFLGAKVLLMAVLPLLCGL